MKQGISIPDRLDPGRKHNKKIIAIEDGPVISLKDFGISATSQQNIIEQDIENREMVIIDQEIMLDGQTVEIIQETDKINEINVIVASCSDE